MDLEAGRNGTARRPRTGGDLELSSSRYSPAGTRSRYARAGRGRESTKPAGCLGLGLGAPVGGSRLRSGPFPRNVPAAPGAAGGLGKGLSFQAPASLCQGDSGNISCITILVLYNSKLLQTTFVNIICFFMLIEHRTFAADGCAFRSRAGKPLPRLPLLRPLPPRFTPSPLLPEPGGFRVSQPRALRWGGGPWAASFFRTPRFQISFCSNTREAGARGRGPGALRASFACASFSRCWLFGSRGPLLSALHRPS